MNEPRQAFSEADLLSAGAPLCFIYTLHASNDLTCRPRYIGFTRNPKEREKRHFQKKKNSGRRGLWIQELKLQKARIVLTVIFSFRSKDLTECSIIEASWIESYRKKFPDLLNDAGGGEGLAQPSVSMRCKISEAIKKHFADPAKREAMSKKLKKFFSDPKQRERSSQIKKLFYQDPLARAKLSRAFTEARENPEVQAKLSASRKRIWENPEHKAKRSAETKLLWSNPEYRAKRKASATKAYSDPEVRAKMKAAANRGWASPDYRAKRAATIARKKLEKELNGY